MVTRTGASHYCTDLESLQLVHVSADDLCGNFQAMLEGAQRKLKRPLIPVAKMADKVHVRALGLSQTLHGFTVWPAWSEIPDCGRILTSVCGDGNTRSLQDLLRTMAGN